MASVESRSRRRAVGLKGAVVCLGLLVAGTASADPSNQDSDEARQLMREGDSRYAAHDYRTAYEKYLAADQIMHVPSTGLAVARAQAALGKLVEARDIALGVLRKPPAPKEPAAFVRARQEADVLAQELAARIPSIQLVISGAAGAELKVEVDGIVVPKAAVSLPRRLNPGAHTVAVSAEGFRPIQRSVTLTERAHQKLELKLEPLQSKPNAAPAPAPSNPAEDRTRTSSLVYIGFGAAGAGILVGTITGLISISKTNDIQDRCGNDCPESEQSNVDSANTFALISNISFGVAAAGAGVGIYGLLTPARERSESRARFTPLVAPSFVGVRGRF